MNERQELHCHACGRYVQFTLDLSLNGNHVLECPNCGHEHCRVVQGGKITDIRWDRRNGPTIYVSAGSTNSTFISLYDSTTSSGVGGSIYLSMSWTNTGAN